MTPNTDYDDHDEQMRLRNYKDISLTDLYHTLQRQGDSVSDLKKQLEPLAELATNVRLLNERLLNLSTEVAKFESVKDTVTIHKTVHWILGAVCGLVFPVLVTWNFQHDSEMRTLQSGLDKANEKIQALERVTYTKHP